MKLNSKWHEKVAVDGTSSVGKIVDITVIDANEKSLRV